MKQQKDPATPIQYVKGIGPRRAEALEERGIHTVRDLLYYFPRGYIDLSKIIKARDLRKQANSGNFVTLIGTVRAFDLLGRPPRQRFVVVLGDETGTAQLVFFRSVTYFKKAFEVGETLAVSGRVTMFGSKPQLVHPSIDRLTSAGDDESGGTDGYLHTKGIVPKYGSSEELREVNLNVKGLRRIMRTLVDEFVDNVEDTLPEEIRTRNALISLPEALRSIHFPESEAALQSARRRLKFDELFSMQLMLALRRNSVKSDLPGIAFNTRSELARRVESSLPFWLTAAQRRVLTEIASDMAAPRPMHRLLQGDVGSGKTVVALICILIALDNKYQAAFMAPTEILAEQHYRTLAAYLKGTDVNIRLLVGNQRSRLREDVLEDIRSGSAALVVGTHALIQESVQFARLGLVVIDEQHRFGVGQRLALKEKAHLEKQGIPHPDMLVMTATPIPRTLSLTLYGDLDVSVIDELPANRKEIKTGLRFDSQKESVYRFLREEVAAGRQAYIVYPLVEESEKLDLRAATESYESLKSNVFSDLRLGLLHGRMSTDEKEKVMFDFKERRIDILVATTVIEVGIDIPNASVMVIEHAERFGLSQLHQLRGRVGRGTDQSYCILIAPDWLGKVIKRHDSTVLMSEEGEEEMLHAARRLKTMVETTDGFKIAEIDLELRGPGEFFGTRQSGLPLLQIANLLTDGELLSAARREAYKLIDSDPHLRRPEHEHLREAFESRMREALANIGGG